MLPEMRPITLDVLQKCCKQAEDLFDHFLRLDSQFEDLLPKRQSREIREEYTPFSCRVQQEKRLSSGNIESPVRARGAEGLDLKSFELDLAKKRRSLEIEKRRSLGATGSSPPCHSTLSSMSPPVQRDSGLRLRELERSVEKQESDVIYRRSCPIPLLSNGHDEYQPQIAEEGPTDRQLHQAALTIAAVGDQIDREYGDKMDKMKTTVTDFIRNAEENISYDIFAVYLNDLVGQDRSWADFVCMMHLSRRVIVETKHISRTIFQYLRRFIGDAFAEEIARENDVVEYVSHSSTSPR